MPLPQFQAANVTAVAKISTGHPVFCVTFTDGNRYVVKAESMKETMPVGRPAPGDRDTQRTSMDFGFRAMRKVVHGPKARPLDNYETTEFYSLKTNAVIDGATKQEIKTQEKERATTMLVIMELLDGLKDAEGMAASNDEVEIRKMLLGLFKPESLEHLGRLIAVDLFIGNEDRFEFS